MGHKAPRRSKRNEQHEEVELHDQQGPQKRKRWSLHDLASIKAMNASQADMLEGWFSGNNVCAHGSAGAGKSFLSCYAALTSLLDPRDSTQQIIIVRSAVTTRDVGHLPGTLEEKQSVYETPYVDIFSALLGRENSYQDMKDARKVRFMLTSHVRGLTWDNAVVIIDEAQNMTAHECDSVITRLGKNSRLIISGDTKQTDLARFRNEQEGLSRAVRIMQSIDYTTVVKFTPDDCVRSGFVRDWLRACESA